MGARGSPATSARRNEKARQLAIGAATHSSLMKRKHEIVGAELGLGTISQPCALTQAARPVDQFSHAPRLSVTPKGRKLVAWRCPSDWRT